MYQVLICELLLQCDEFLNGYDGRRVWVKVGRRVYPFVVHVQTLVLFA